MRVRTVSLHWSGSPAWRRRASAKFGRADEADLDRRRGASDRPVRRNLAALKRQAGDLALAAAISHSSPARPARRCVRHHYDASKKKARVTTLQQVSLTIRARLVRKPTPPRCRASSRWRVDIGLKLRGPLRLEKAPRLPMKMLLVE